MFGKGWEAGRRLPHAHTLAPFFYYRLTIVNHIKLVTILREMIAFLGNVGVMVGVLLTLLPPVMDALQAAGAAAQWPDSTKGIHTILVAVSH